MKNFKYILISLFLFNFACTPMKSTSKEEKHQLELTLHEVQTGLDDLRHDLNCFRTEIQITDSKIKHQEDSLQNLKLEHIEKIQTKLDSLLKQIALLESNFCLLEKKHTALLNDISSLINYSKESNLALLQHKEKINELETALLQNDNKILEISKIKVTLDEIIKTLKSDNENYIIYKVKNKDSLEKIAKNYNVQIETLKKVNNLENDLIVVGQKLKIPKN